MVFCTTMMAQVCVLKRGSLTPQLARDKKIKGEAPFEQEVAKVKGTVAYCIDFSGESALPLTGCHLNILSFLPHACSFLAFPKA